MMADSDRKDDQFVVMNSYPTKTHAEMVVEALENEGIPAMIRSNEMFGAGTGLGTIEPARIEVCVPEQKLDEARAIADSTLDHM